MNRFLCSLVLYAIVSLPISFGQVPGRVANTTLNMPSELFSSVAYDMSLWDVGSIGEAVAMATPPGETNRVFVVDRAGLIRVIPDLANPATQLFMDITNRVESGFAEEGLLGLAFHPNYASNGFFYVAYTGVNTNPSSVHFDVISRFSVSTNDVNLGDASSEMVLIRQEDDPWARNHNGGDLHFGPDGYLYVSLGDGGDFINPQRIDLNYYSAILRIDVDMKPGSLLPNPHVSSVGAYAIPPDNPYIGATSFNGTAVSPTNVRTEFYAVGVRNPWRMSVDPVSGEVIVGDVGEDLYEEVNYIVPGGNYGWPYREGFDARSPVPPPGAVFMDPIHAYPRSGGLSVIGGFIYRGDLLPELNGHYIFTDWSNGELRALVPDGTNVAPVRLLVDTPFGFGPTGFGKDPRNGDLILIEGAGQDSTLRRLIRNTNNSTSDLPVTLAATHAFTNLVTLEASPGIQPYEINAPFWSDDAIKTRWHSLPDTNLAYGFDAMHPWALPASSVWIKHFDIDMEQGNPATRQRLETRFLVKTTTTVYGVTYRWDSATNATLVPEQGYSEDLVRNVGGMVVTQRWDYPSQGACLACHTESGGYALGFNTAQLNRYADLGGHVTNQLIALSQQGYITNVIDATGAFHALVSADEEEVSLTWRVRSYLQANCAQCHDGSGIAHWDARVSTLLADAKVVDAELSNPGSNPAKRVIKPGDLSLSEILQRIQIRGGGQMPPIGSHLVDTQAVALITAYIHSLSNWVSYATWSSNEMGSVQAKQGDFDGDGLNNYGEYLLKLDPDNASDTWGLSGVDQTNGYAGLSFVAPADVAVMLEYQSEPNDSSAWVVMDDRTNALRYPASSEINAYTDHTTSSGRVYRARVLAP